MTEFIGGPSLATNWRHYPGHEPKAEAQKAPDSVDLGGSDVNDVIGRLAEFDEVWDRYQTRVAAIIGGQSAVHTLELPGMDEISEVS
jgi:hypothetical protein